MVSFRCIYVINNLFWKLLHIYMNQHNEWFERSSALMIWRMQLSHQEGHLATVFLKIKASERLWETDLEGGETFIWRRLEPHCYPLYLPDVGHQWNNSSSTLWRCWSARRPSTPRCISCQSLTCESPRPLDAIRWVQILWHFSDSDSTTITQNMIFTFSKES